MFSKFENWRKDREVTIAFFHPQCENFGGGEKVLWSIVYDLLSRDFSKKVIIYANKKVDKKELLNNVNKIFNIPLNSPSFFDRISIISLKLGFLSTIGLFKLWMVNIGAMVASLEALFFQWPFPRTFIETAGFSFALIPAKLLPTTIYTATYLHYPQVTKNQIENSKKKYGMIRYLYLKIFSFFYYISIKLTNKIVVNSNWTRYRFQELCNDKNLIINVCYPPINMNALTDSNKQHRKDVIISLSQFRAEKNHAFQIKIFSEFLRKIQDLLQNKQNSNEKLKLEKIYKNLKFKICGTSQTSSTEYNLYLNSLKKIIKSEGLEDRIELIIDSSSKEIQELLFTSKIGIHTMEDEHFGICVAEFLSAGLLVVAHKSGGPETDILAEHNNKKVGFLASTLNEYVDILVNLTTNYESTQVQEILINANHAVSERFQDNKSFGRTCTQILNI